ncbi:17730_t:CDS:2, partial [Acaulospora morrowiae]
MDEVGAQKFKVSQLLHPITFINKAPDGNESIKTIPTRLVDFLNNPNLKNSEFQILSSFADDAGSRTIRGSREDDALGATDIQFYDVFETPLRSRKEKKIVKHRLKKMESNESSADWMISKHNSNDNVSESRTATISHQKSPSRERKENMNLHVDKISPIDTVVIINLHNGRSHSINPNRMSI